jgi:hypothetical protein
MITALLTLRPSAAPPPVPAHPLPWGGCGRLYITADHHDGSATAARGGCGPSPRPEPPCHASSQGTAGLGEGSGSGSGGPAAGDPRAAEPPARRRRDADSEPTRSRPVPAGRASPSGRLQKGPRQHLAAVNDTTILKLVARTGSWLSTSNPVPSSLDEPQAAYPHPVTSPRPHPPTPCPSRHHAARGVTYAALGRQARLPGLASPPVLAAARQGCQSWQLQGTQLEASPGSGQAA